jgi:hypothetical protein
MADFSPLTDDELAEFAPPPSFQVPGSGPDAVRAQVILKDIYARHGIPRDVPPEDAAALILAQAQDAGLADDQGPSSAWASPEERAQARMEYANQGATDDEAMSRWQESAYLMDPGRVQYHREYGRDADFLDGVARAQSMDLSGPRAWGGGHTWTGQAGAAPEADGALASAALDNWDRSNGSPLYRRGLASETYASTGGIPAAVGNAVNNAPMDALEYLPDSFRYGTSDGSTGALTGASNSFAARRMQVESPAPIVPPSYGLTPNATPQERAAAIREYQALVRSGVPESAASRIHRATGIAPSQAVADAAAVAESIFDGTQAIPLLGYGMSAARGVKGVGRAALRGAAYDAGQDAAIGGSLMAGFVQQPGRTWSEYITKGVPIDESNAANRDAAQAALTEIHNSGGPGVSTADREAYKRLRRARGMDADRPMEKMQGSLRDFQP